MLREYIDHVFEHLCGGSMESLGQWHDRQLIVVTLAWNVSTNWQLELPSNYKDISRWRTGILFKIIRTWWKTKLHKMACFMWHCTNRWEIRTSIKLIFNEPVTETAVHRMGLDPDGWFTEDDLDPVLTLRSQSSTGTSCYRTGSVARRSGPLRKLLCS